MKLMQIKELIDAYALTDINEDEISFAISSDLLSWVMANGCEGCIFITIQTSMNVIAVASLLEMSCIVITSDSNIDKTVIDKANEENITILRTNLSTFEVCGILYENGIRPVK